MPARIDPLTNGRFLIEIDGIASTNASHVEGLSGSIEIVDSQNSSAVTLEDFKQPGLRKYSNIILKRGLTTDTSFWDWFNATQQGQLTRRSGRIALLDSQMNPVVGWVFTNGWPCRWSGPDLAAASNDLAIETLEICHEGLQMVVQS